MVTKDDVKDIVNAYQNHINDFVNITDKDIDKIYLQSAKNYFDRIELPF